LGQCSAEKIIMAKGRYLPGRRPGFVRVLVVAGAASCVVLVVFVVPDSAEAGDEMSDSI
jgi:hypothetical protein